jgi:nucleosome assembly protein 1-like 1
MLAHTNLSHAITEKDRAILQYLEDIKLNLHDSGFGFTLVFVFESNSYFTGTELKKEFTMTKPNVVEKCLGTTIEWAVGCDPTKEKKKKKVKQNGKQKTVTTTVKCDSFFNFFATLEASEIADKKPSDDDSEDGDDNKVGEQMDHDFDMGNDIKDDIVPLALEYYLGVIEKEEEGDDDDQDDDDDEEEPKP